MFKCIMLRPLFVSVAYESNDEFTLFGFIKGPGVSSTSPDMLISSVAMYKKSRTGYINEREAMDVTCWRNMTLFETIFGKFREYFENKDGKWCVMSLFDTMF